MSRFGSDFGGFVVLTCFAIVWVEFGNLDVCFCFVRVWFVVFGDKGLIVESGFVWIVFRWVFLV